MNIPLDSEYESIVRWWLATGQFDTPKSVVQAALSNMKPVSGRELSETMPDPPLAYDESISILDFPHLGPARIITPIRSTEPHLPEILFDVDGE